MKTTSAIFPHKGWVSFLASYFHFRLISAYHKMWCLGMPMVLGVRAKGKNFLLDKFFLKCNGLTIPIL